MQLVRVSSIDNVHISIYIVVMRSLRFIAQVVRVNCLSCLLSERRYYLVALQH